MSVMERELVVQGLVERFGSGKEASWRLNISPSLFSQIGSGERTMADDIKRKASKYSLKSAMGIIKEITRYMIFNYTKGDRHPQTMLRRVEKEDHEADEAIKELGWRLIDKNSPEDLTDEDRIALTLAAKEMADRIKTDLNMLIEWEDRYKLGLLDLLVEKEKPLKAAR